jgi:subtilase family serine protease
VTGDVAKGPSLMSGQSNERSQTTVCASRGSRTATAGGTIPLLFACLALAFATAADAQIRPEFLKPARSLVTQNVDRNRTVGTLGALGNGIAQLNDMGEVSPTLAIRHMQMLLRRTVDRQASFDALVEAQHTRGNPSFHHWLTPEQVGSNFGPSASDLAALLSYLRSEGFTVENTGKSGLYVDFSGTAAQVERAFHTSIHNVQMANGEVKYSAVADASVPEALSPLVVGFVSLSNIPSANPNYTKLAAPAIPVSRRPSPITPLDTESSTNYAVGPQDFYTIYNELPLLNAATPINGSGVTIALLEESAINPADVTTFRTNYGVTPAAPVSLVVDTGYGSNTCTAPAMLESTGEEGEAILDIEWTGAVAPGANLLFMQCATQSVLGVFYSAEAVIDNNLADVMSLSYGQFEGYSTTEDTLANDLWEQAASQGQTVVVSAGDTGAAAEDGNDGNKYAKHGITASSFSTTAWNVSAGGTDFQDTYNGAEGSPNGIAAYWNSGNAAGLSSAKSYIPEMTWNDTCASSIYNAYVEGASADPATLCGATSSSNLYLAGGGGAPSKLHTRPSWQTGTVFGLPATSAYPTRLQPDVSLFASNGFWYHDLPSYESDESPATSYAGGTSFVAPQLAGVFALIKQATGERLGQPNYVLYAMAGQEYGTSSFVGGACNGSGASGIGTTTSAPGAGCIFYDVQTGTSSVDCRSGGTNCYTLSGKPYGILSTTTTAESPAFATNAGWDQATGIGSINIANLVTNWQASGELFTPIVAVTSSSSSLTYGATTAITYTANVSGSDSYPTGSVSFSGSAPIGAIGSPDALTGSAACSTGSTCVESAMQSYTPTGTLPPGSYTITATYSSTNENYSSGAMASAGLSIVAQTPGLSVSSVGIPYGNTVVTLSASVAFTGSGAPPSGGLSFQVDDGSSVAATCTGTASPLNCTAAYALTGLASGDHTITAILSADVNYNGVSSTGTLNLYLNASTIAFSVASPQHTFAPTFTVSASSNSSAAFTYSVTSGPATISSSTVTVLGAGTVTLQASQAANSTYSTTTASATFNVLAGSVWLGNNTGSLSVFDLTGSALVSSGLTGGGVGTIASPLGLAFDASGNIWVANGNGLGEFNAQGSPVTSAPFTGGGIANPLAVAIEGSGQVWVANAAGTVSVLSNSGTAVSPSTGYSGPGSTPAGIAIDISGSVWIPSSTANTVTRILGVAAPVVPLAIGAASGPGAKP